MGGFGDGRYHGKGHKSVSGTMARLFLERLDQGLLIDRTRPSADGQYRKKIKLPPALHILKRKPGQT